MVCFLVAGLKEKASTPSESGYTYLKSSAAHAGGLLELAEPERTEDTARLKIFAEVAEATEAKASLARLGMEPAQQGRGVRTSRELSPLRG